MWLDVIVSWSKKKTKRDDFYLQLQNLTRKHIDIEDKVKQKLNDTLP